MNGVPSGLGINDILKFQRNRYPVLLIDRVLECEPGKRSVARKCFTYNEWFIPGHFEDEPNVPGTVQVECLAQTLLITFLCIEEYQGMKANAASYNNVKFRRKVEPGDILIVEARLRSFKRGVAMGSAVGRVEDEVACSADFVIVVPDVLEKFRPAVSH
jgi:3-hydroxyacyl-[acyl-carrier-protein] dehydratase